MKKITFSAASALLLASCLVVGNEAYAQYASNTKSSSPPSLGKKSNAPASVQKGADEAGRVIYSDRPMSGVDAKQQLQDRKFKDVNPDANRDHREEVKIIRSKEFSRIQEQKIVEARQKEQNNEASRARSICDNAKITLSNISKGIGTTFINEKGQSVSKSSQRVTAEREYALKMIKEHCGRAMNLSPR